jgi:hypothetical protein
VTLEQFGVGLVFLHLVIPNSVNEARVFSSAQVGVRDLVFLFEESTLSRSGSAALEGTKLRLEEKPAKDAYSTADRELR